MIKTTKLIEKIEGEAKLHFTLKNDKIDFVEIEFLSSRHIEDILKGKSPLDALVITPRVCGICGHAHLIATVKALENCYEQIHISQKAKIIRELTLNFELIQNHFKWFYMVILPLIGQKQQVLKAVLPSQLMAKAIAVLAGQYPHTSYAIVGGIVSEITQNDIICVQNFIYETIKFFKKNFIDVDIENFLVCENIDKIVNSKGELSSFFKTIEKSNLQRTGGSYDRFIVFGENSYFKKGKSLTTRINSTLDVKFVQESENKNSYAKNVKYRGKYYETGPLSRAMINKIPLIRESHRRYKDSLYSRILARICEIPQLLYHSNKLLEEINLKEPSFINPPSMPEFCSGTGIVEAARGSLIHKIEITHGKIKDYQIITPIQWNLGNGTKEEPAIAQKAMMGLKDKNIAELVFKSFDICSVCATH